MGKIIILIGPNGFGKTYSLENIYKKRLIDTKVDEKLIFFMPAEIYLEDEVKDTDTSTTRSKTMEFLLTDLFDTSLIETKRLELKAVYDNEIKVNQSLINTAFQESAFLNGSKRTKNFIEESSKLSIAKPVTINAGEFKSLMGSGQKYYFFMQLLKRSKKQYIFLDEPEQYSHPSLQNALAKIIEELLSSDRELFISTHSPKLISMLNIEFESIRVINDNTHKEKVIDFISIINKLNLELKNSILSMNKNDKLFYDVDSFKVVLSKYYYRDFIESLFTKKVILCEGYSDELFIKKVLFESNHYYDDYYIFRTNGKFKMPIFADCFKSLGIDVRIYFDQDDIKNNVHKDINEYIVKNYANKYYMFTDNLEVEIGISDKKNKLVSSEMLDFLATWGYDSKYDIWD